MRIDLPARRSERASALVLALLVLGAPTALADDWTGAWRAGPLEIQNQIGSWGPDCPARLPATQTEPGGDVQVRQSGDQLTFTGAVRGATNQCWSSRPGLRRASTTYQDGRWTTVCRTSPDDAQGEDGTYRWRAAGDSQLIFEETTRWNWRLAQSHCVATRTARRTLTRVGAPVAAVTMTPEPTPTEPAETCTPGPAARVRLTPTEETIAPGGQVCVQARVVDARNCRVPNAPISYSLVRPSGARGGTFEGRCFTAPAAAAEAEGTFRIVATSGALRAETVVVVETEDLTALTARRLREAGATGATGPAEAAGGSGVAARALGEGGIAPAAWIGGGVGLLLVLGVVFLALGRRRASPAKSAPAELDDIPSGAPAAAPSPSAPASASIVAGPVATAAPTPPPKRVCPTCGQVNDRGAQFCPHDGATLLDPEDPKLRARGMICPTCRRGYPADARRCNHDGDELEPYALFSARQKHAADAGKKVCPVCGTTYDADVVFCGKDGASLQTLN
ncbi:MAG: zinc ribbon domain-containing protein [Myxococcales bacterium]|nr:zinc ribbon domain-containing protein [Myxococcales bacterium]